MQWVDQFVLGHFGPLCSLFWDFLAGMLIKMAISYFAQSLGDGFSHFWAVLDLPSVKVVAVGFSEEYYSGHSCSRNCHWQTRTDALSITPIYQCASSTIPHTQSCSKLPAAGIRAQAGQYEVFPLLLTRTGSSKTCNPLRESLLHNSDLHPRVRSL